LLARVPGELLDGEVEVAAFLLGRAHFPAVGEHFPVDVGQFAVDQQSDAALEFADRPALALIARALLRLELPESVEDLAEGGALLGEGEFALGLLHEEVLEELVGGLEGVEGAGDEEELGVVDAVAAVGGLR
jgi:hypothetical protein